MRATWNGYMRLGTLSVPVKLYSATRSVGPHFVQLHATDLAPVTRTLVCQKDGETIEYKDTIRAIDKDGQYVEVSDDELQTGTNIERDIVIRQFSEPCDIDPMYYDKPYYVVPGEGGDVGYMLLRQAFIKAKKVAIVTYLMYEKQHMGIISAVDGMLRMQQLRYVDEIVPTTELPAQSLPQPAPGHVDTAVKVMDRYSTPFYIGDYRNEQNAALKELVDRRIKGLKPKRQSVTPTMATSENDVIKIMKEILGDQQQRSLKASVK
jgi:DNA end-binding protein Ku